MCFEANLEMGRNWNLLCWITWHDSFVTFIFGHLSNFHSSFVLLNRISHSLRGSDENSDWASTIYLFLQGESHRAAFRYHLFLQLGYNFFRFVRLYLPHEKENKILYFYFYILGDPSNCRSFSHNSSFHFEFPLFSWKSCPVLGPL